MHSQAWLVDGMVHLDRAIPRAHSSLEGKAGRAAEETLGVLGRGHSRHVHFLPGQQTAATISQDHPGTLASSWAWGLSPPSCETSKWTPAISFHPPPPSSLPQFSHNRMDSCEREASPQMGAEDEMVLNELIVGDLTDFFY